MRFELSAYDEGKLTFEAKHLYMANDGNLRLDYEPQTSNRRSSGSVIGPEGRFVVDRNPGESQYFIRKVGSDATSIEKIRNFSYVPFVYFCDNSGSIADRLKAPGFVIDAVTESLVNPAIVMVKYRWGLSPPCSAGEWSFDSSKGWILTGFTHRQNPDGKWLEVEKQVTLEYEGDLDGIPILKRCTDLNKRTDSGKVAGEKVFKVTEVSRCDAGPEQFILAAYGVRYQQGPAPDRSWRWLVFGGIAAAIGGIVLRVFLHRKSE